jgi:hypothetical protein
VTLTLSMPAISSVTPDCCLKIIRACEYSKQIRATSEQRALGRRTTKGNKEMDIYLSNPCPLRSNMAIPHPLCHHISSILQTKLALSLCLKSVNFIWIDWFYWWRVQVRWLIHIDEVVHRHAAVDNLDLDLYCKVCTW